MCTYDKTGRVERPKFDSTSYPSCPLPRAADDPGISEPEDVAFRQPDDPGSLGEVEMEVAGSADEFSFLELITNPAAFLATFGGKR